ncbi:hypothetical protein [Streptomyces sp. NPDC056632]|uniref:hypothetical protein n=1 Tax=Streptomyces sp. NPDC056632 TaxID=3345884 RepID=UPI003692466B
MTFPQHADETPPHECVEPVEDMLGDSVLEVGGPTAHDLSEPLLHLDHNEWDPVKGRAAPKVLFTFGREDDLDRDAVKRLVASLSRLLEPGEALASTAAGDLEFVSSVPFGGTYVLDHLWRRLRIDKIVGQVGQPRRGRRRDMSVFSLVANRALAPSSKLAAADWVTHDVHVDGLPATDDNACYRAMDWLHEVSDDLEKRVFDEVAMIGLIWPRRE